MLIGFLCRATITYEIINGSTLKNNLTRLKPFQKLFKYLGGLSSFGGRTAIALAILDFGFLWSHMKAKDKNGKELTYIQNSKIKFEQ